MTGNQANPRKKIIRGRGLLVPSLGQIRLRSSRLICSCLGAGNFERERSRLWPA